MLHDNAIRQFLTCPPGILSVFSSLSHLWLISPSDLQQVCLIISLAISAFKPCPLLVLLSYVLCLFKASISVSVCHAILCFVTFTLMLFSKDCTVILFSLVSVSGLSTLLYHSMTVCRACELQFQTAFFDLCLHSILHGCHSSAVWRVSRGQNNKKEKSTRLENRVQQIG